MLEDNQVSEDIATACLLAALHRRIVLISSKESRLAELQTVGVLERLLNRRCTVIYSSEDTTWPRLAADLDHSRGGSIVIKNIHELKTDVQTHLLDALYRPQPSPVSLAETVIVALGSYDTLIRSLRQTILYCENVEVLSETRHLALPLQLGFNEQLTRMRLKMRSLTLVPDVRRYMQDIIVFTRFNRLVKSGVSPRVTHDLELLVRSLCLLQDLDFATPSIVSTAVRKMLPMKVELCAPEKEPSLQWGGDLDVARVWLGNWNNDLLVESILETVPPPL